MTPVDPELATRHSVLCPDSFGDRVIASLLVDEDTGAYELHVVLEEARTLVERAREDTPSDALYLEEPPPPGSPPFARASRRVIPGDADFLEALRSYWSRFFGLEVS